MGSIRLNHLDLSVAQFLDTATGELAPRQTPAQRKCDGLLLEEPRHATCTSGLSELASLTCSTCAGQNSLG